MFRWKILAAVAWAVGLLTKGLLLRLNTTWILNPDRES